MNSCFAGYQYDLSICMIFRDEAPYLKEWIEFHRLLGVEHFYLYSHNSQDHYKAVLMPYIKKGIVELKEIVTNDSEELNDFFNSLQIGVYNECLAQARGVSKWVAFIDSDEYLFPTQANSLVDFLKDYKEFGGVVANWQMFGTSHVEKLASDRLMIEQLICCAQSELQYNAPIKSIVQPKHAVRFDKDPHHLVYYMGYSQVNTDKVSFKGPISPYIQVNQLRINHYWTRDEFYFWNYKFPRQIKWVDATVETFNDISDKYNQDTDLTIQRFVPQLRKKMRLRNS